MNDLVQPGKVHLKRPSLLLVVVTVGCDVVVAWPSGPIIVVVVVVLVVEVVSGARCFFEMCPVRAASEAKLALSQDCQLHLVTPLIRWIVFRCFLRSVVEAKLAPQTVPQGMIHWHAREVEGAEMADRRALVSVSGPSGGEVGVGGVGMGVESMDAGAYPEGAFVVKFGISIC